MWMSLRIVLCNMELIGCPDEGSVVFEIDLHDAQTGSVSGREVESDALAKVKVVIGEGVPVQLVQSHVAREVDTKVSPRGDRPASVLEFFLVDVNWHIGANEMLEATSVIEVQVANDNSLDILDVITGGFNRSWEALVFPVFNTREYIGYGSAPLLRPIVSAIIRCIAIGHVPHQCLPHSQFRTE